MWVFLDFFSLQLIKSFQAKKEELLRKIMEEREACMKLNVDIGYIELINKAN